MKYTETHEWIKIEGNKGTVGITQFAQNELKEVVSIQLPVVGSRLELGEDAAILESTKAAVDIYSPVSGKIIEINEKVKKDPQILNQSPESGGWLFKIELSDIDELDTLLDLEQYLQIVSISK